MNTNFKVIGLTRLRIESGSTAPKADALTTRPSELCYVFTGIKKLSQETFVTNEIIFRAPKLSHYFPSRQDWIEKHKSLEDRYDCLIKSRSLGFEGPSDEGVDSHSDEEQCCDVSEEPCLSILIRVSFHVRV